MKFEVKKKKNQLTSLPIQIKETLVDVASFFYLLFPPQIIYNFWILITN